MADAWQILRVKRVKVAGTLGVGAMVSYVEKRDWFELFIFLS
jgi:hypothetical protein